jgi:hypothetical protein
MYKWTKSNLHNHSAQILVDGKYGHKVLLRQEFSQRGKLPPTLFILYMNDLVPILLKGIHAALYADDLFRLQKSMQPLPPIPCSKHETRSQNGKTSGVSPSVNKGHQYIFLSL